MKKINIKNIDKDENLKNLKNIIKQRAKKRKQSRSKINNPQKIENPDFNNLSNKLDYRFSNAKIIINDILERNNKND